MGAEWESDVHKTSLTGQPGEREEKEQRRWKERRRRKEGGLCSCSAVRGTYST